MSQKASKKFRKQIQKDLDKSWNKIVDAGLKLSFWGRFKFGWKVLWKKEKLLKKRL